MIVDLATVLPNIQQSLDGTGFLFGAGTSCEAGYPMMSGLTSSVLTALNGTDRETLDTVLTTAGHPYDASLIRPNIEQIVDLVIAHWTNSGDAKFQRLELRIRELIVEQILAVRDPLLDHHCRFFEALKKRSFGMPCTVWIFTTNYDLLLETAASRAGVAIENGFSGTTERFFDPAQFLRSSGEIVGRQFSPCSQLKVKLIKLHGSISWAEESTLFYERHPAALTQASRRILILPRRRKVLDTLTPPYDTLFTQAIKVIGGECKYLVSCGFSFADEHINQQLLIPALGANRARLFALSHEEPAGISGFKAFPSFRGGFSSHLLQDGRAVSGTTDYWKFSKFVTLFE